MNKLLRDNGYALALGAVCLAFSAWLYASNTPSQTASAPTPVAAGTPGTGNRPVSVAGQDARRQIPLRKTAPQEHAGGAGQPDFKDLNLSPADWHDAAKQ